MQSLNTGLSSASEQMDSRLYLEVHRDMERMNLDGGEEECEQLPSQSSSENIIKVANNDQSQAARWDAQALWDAHVEEMLKAAARCEQLWKEKLAREGITQTAAAMAPLPLPMPALTAMAGSCSTPDHQQFAGLTIRDVRNGELSGERG